MAKKKVTINRKPRPEPQAEPDATASDDPHATSSAGDSAKGSGSFFNFFSIPDSLADQARDIWMAGLGALAAVEEEGTKVFSQGAGR